jgi:alkanesulfonate monooxygenase
MSLQFHWRLLQGGERLGATTRLAQTTIDEAALPDLPQQAAFCRNAVAAGLSSLLVDFSYAKPDPMLLAAALAVRVPDIRLMVAIRSGVLSPTLFVQQVNTLSQLSGQRVCLNVVAGYSPEEQGYYGDFLPHDERYERTEEFLEICNRLWDGNAVTLQGTYFRVEEAKIATTFSSDAGQRPEIFIG